MLVISLMAALATQTATPGPLSGAVANLIQPREIQLILDGRHWTCGSDGTCEGRGTGRSQPTMRECRRFVGRLGAVSTFARGGLALTETEVSQCNAGYNGHARRLADPG